MPRTWQTHAGVWSVQQLGEQIRRGSDCLADILGQPVRCSAAAGWRGPLGGQAALRLPLQQAHAADAARSARAWPTAAPASRTVPVNLPTFDEVVGPGLPREAYNDFILERFAAGRDNVYTIHAEVEGLLLAPAFRELLAARRTARHPLLRPLGAVLLDVSAQPAAGRTGAGRLAGREGWLGVRQP